jgi:penicillin-binding protein 1C
MKIFLIKIALGCMVGVSLLLLALAPFRTLPPAETIWASLQAETSFLRDRTGTHILYELHGDEDRQVLAHDEIPDIVRFATIATEDRYFRSHFGFDPIGIVRALAANIRAGEIVQGGSTLTQQLARNLTGSREKTLYRKIRETLMALELEFRYGKDDILDRYLNTVSYGSDIYGIGAASQSFFGKKASELTIDEAAMLTALLKATTTYSPYGENVALLNHRKAQILRLMRDEGYINGTQYEKALLTDTIAKVLPREDRIFAPHFVFAVLDELRDLYGEDRLRRGGLDIRTTLDFETQQAVSDIVSAGALRNDRQFSAENAAATVIDVPTGEVLAMVGSRNFFDTAIDGEVNVVLRPRQPGSSFKPIIYSAAFEKGYQPEDLIADTPTNFGADGSGAPYIPRNYDGRFHGTVSFRQALSNSLNVPAVKVLSAIGLPAGIAMAKNLGLSTLDIPMHFGLSFALGAADVKLLDMVSAFSVFARDGEYISPQMILSVKKNGEELLLPKTSQRQAVSPETARKISSILSDNQARSMIFGSHSPLAFPGSIVAAKTGTSQEFRDAWTLGYTRQFALGVWAGNNDHRPMRAGADGVFVAAPLWRSIVDRLLLRSPAEPFLAYTKTASDPALKLADESPAVVLYYRISTGKKISAEKAARIGMDKVRIEKIFPEADSAGN